MEALIKTKTRNKVRIHHLEERVGDSVAFLSYAIDDQNQMTIFPSSKSVTPFDWRRQVLFEASLPIYNRGDSPYFARRR